MKINHEKTKENILKIISLLNAQGESASRYIKQYHEVVDDQTKSQSYQAEQVELLRVNYYNGYEERKKQIREIIEMVAETEAYNDSIVELDVPEYSNTVAIIHATGGDLPEEFISNAKYNFAGNYNAITSLVALLECYGLKSESFGYKEYARHSSEALNEIDIMVKDLERSEQAVFLDLRMIYEKILTFGKVRGLEFAESELNDDALRNELAEDLIANQVMGIK